MVNRPINSAKIKNLKNIKNKRRAHLTTTAEEMTHLSLGPEQKGILITHNSTMVIIKSPEGKLVSCTLRQNLGTLVTGDNVIWQAIDEDKGVVVGCEPRRSVIMRPDSRSTKPIVANVDAMVIVVALSPLPQNTTIDRYLLLADLMSIKALIVVNKFDVLFDKKHMILLDKLASYEQLGYQVIKISTKTKMGLPELIDAIKGINSILVGQSGVGKSSLLNALVPDAQAQTGALSDGKLGRQTTTASKYYHLNEGGNIIDSPGIHQFNLRHFTQEQVFKGFKDFAPYAGRCQFRNCRHANESGCALIQAVNEGALAAFRLDNYHAILLDKE